MNSIKTLVLVLLLSVISFFSLGQKYSVHKEKKSYLGLTGGINFNLPTITDRYSVLTGVGSLADENAQKNYDGFGKNRGAQFGVRYSYNITNWISIVAGFGYQSIGYNYLTNYAWTDTVNNQNFSREMYHVQNVSYFTLPVMARWEIGNGQLMPYLQGGFFMDFRHQGKKVIHYDNRIDEDVNLDGASSSATVSITDNINRFNIGAIGGVGLNYYTKYVTFGLESNFHYGAINTVNDQNRFADLNGFALQYLDVFDQMKFNVLNVQLSVSVPLNNSVSSNILRKSRYYKRR